VIYEEVYEEYLRADLFDFTLVQIFGIAILSYTPMQLPDKELYD